MITLSEGEGTATSSYVDSACVLPFSLFDRAKAAVILLFVKTVVITVMETTTLTTRAVTRKPIDIIYAAILQFKLCTPTDSVVSELWLLRFYFLDRR